MTVTPAKRYISAKRILTRCSRAAVSSVVVSVLLGMASGSIAEDKLFYRYLDEQGVPVINHQIPPEFAQKGYEVVTARGDVIKVVAPAPSEKDAALMAQQRQREAELARWDEELRRRYSSVADIDAAKKRKLAQVDGSIAILKSNVRNLKSQIADQHAQAAKSERLGSAVPDSVLRTLAGLEEELQLTEGQIEQREQQYRNIDHKYERDKERFSIIHPD